MISRTQSECCAYGQLCSEPRSNVSTRPLFHSIAGIAIFSLAVYAQSTQNDGIRRLRPLSAEDVLSAVSITNGPLSISRDGRWLVYVVQNPKRIQPPGSPAAAAVGESGTPMSAMGTDIWLTDTQSGHSASLTNGKGNNWSPCWSPDGTRIAFYSDRNGSPHLWLYEIGTNIARQLSSVIARPSEGDLPKWTGDGRRVLTKVLPEGESPQEAGAFVRAAGRNRDRIVNYPDSIVTIYRANEHLQEKRSAESSSLSQDVFTRSKRADLALVQVADGKAEVIAQGFSPAWYEMFPGTPLVAFADAKGQKEANNYQNVFDLFVVELADSKVPRRIASDVPSSIDTVLASFSPDGKWISYITSGADGPADCVLTNVRDGTTRKAARAPHPNFANQYRAPRWSRDSKVLYFIVDSHEIWKLPIDLGTAEKVTVLPERKIISVVAATTSMDNQYWSWDEGKSLIVLAVDDAGGEAFLRIDLATGKSTLLFAADQSFGGGANLVVGSPDTTNIVYASEDAEHSPELWIADRNFQRRKQLSKLNPQLGSYLFGRSQVVEWLSAEGDLLRGALVLPSGYRKGDRYPLVVFVYPGNQGHEVANRFGLFGFAPYFNMQLLATRGYAVLYPDCPVHPGTIMQDVGKAVLPGVNKIIELGIADPSRLGVMGESFGGYATLSLIVQTKRFKAAMMYAGLGNLVSSYGEMGEDGSSYLIGVWENNSRTQFGTPWAARERYIENSPVFYLDRVQTPLLIVHGSNDFAVAPFLGEEIFVDLRRLGKTVVYAKYEGEGHALEGYHNQIDFVGRMIAWLDRYLKN